MNERFKELPEEKQQAVLNAAMEVFSKYDYKKASTDLIAAKAGVSKGLLFYYFHNKKELYLFVYEQAERIITDSIVDSKMMEITDFFELIAYTTMKKVKILEAYPYIMEFCIRSFYSEKEEISDDLKTVNTQRTEDKFNTHFKNIDFSKFKENAEPIKLFKILFWLTDGFIHEQKMNNNTLCLKAVEKEFTTWSEMLKSIA